MRGALAIALRHVAAHWRLKLALSAILTAFFCVPYFTLQRLPILTARTLPLTGIDLAVPFIPGWVWVYQSVYVLLSIVPWLADSSSDLRRYARGFILQASVGFAFFLLFPVEGPRPRTVPGDGMFGLLASYDSPLNSFPSLHVGLAVYTVLFAARVSRARVRFAERIGLLTLLAGWTAAIAFATIATKQHYVVDLPAGVVLAWICHRWAWRTRVESAFSTRFVFPAFQRSAHGEPSRRVSPDDSVCRLPGTSGSGTAAPAAASGEPAGGSGPPVTA